MTGETLLQEVIELTGLPPEPVKRDLLKYMDRFNMSVESLTLEDLRKILGLYLSEAVESTIEN